jgi:hypothetical protein
MLLTVAGGGTPVAHTAEHDPGLRAQLGLVAQRGIFFAHQSVGMNVLDGVKELAQNSKVPISIVEWQWKASADSAALRHIFVPENGRPEEKLSNFERAMSSMPASPDIAILKFCFLDIDGNTDVKALFAGYLSTIDRLRRNHPNTTFVHVTVPLTTVQGGWKALVKRMLGRAPYGVLENRRREEYNALLRATYKGKEPVFDLARIESVGPNGRQETSEWQGENVPALNAAYTNDGSHLNAVGRLRAAREFIAVLFTIPFRHDHVR